MPPRWRSLPISGAEGLNVTVDFKRSHSVEILRQVKRGDLQADGFTLTIATAGGFLVHQQAASHLPFMLMPGMTHGVLAPKQDAISSLPLDGEYYLMKETAGTELLVLRDLVRSHPGASVGLIDAEPDGDRSLWPQAGATWSIIGFPHYEFNVRFNDCLLPFLGRGQHPTKPIVFFLSAEKAANRGYADALAAAGARQLAQVHPVGGDPAARGQPAAGQPRLCRCAVPHHRPVGQASGLRQGAGPAPGDRRRAPAASGCPRMPSPHSTS